MIAKCFADTNVLLYAVDEGAGMKHEVARRTLGGAESGLQTVISTQVLEEFYATAVRKQGLAPTRARELTLLWTNFEVVRIETEDVLAAVDCSILNRLSFWDALIVTAARKAACDTLWTEDLNHGQIIQGVRVENPFLGTGTVRESRARYAARRTARRAAGPKT